MPLNVVTQWMIEDLRHGVPLMAVQVLELSHVASSTSPSAEGPGKAILALGAAGNSRNPFPDCRRGI
jgi:hypothetical protein